MNIFKTTQGDTIVTEPSESFLKATSSLILKMDFSVIKIFPIHLYFNQHKIIHLLHYISTKELEKTRKCAKKSADSVAWPIFFKKN